MDIKYLGPLDEEEKEEKEKSQKLGLKYLGPLETKTTPVIRQDYPTRRKVMQATRPVLEAVGLVGGGLIGSGVGPGGTIAGAGLGYAGADSLSNLLEKTLGFGRDRSIQEEILRSGKKTAEGAAYEMGGQVGGKVVGAIAGKTKNLLGSPFKRTVDPEAIAVEPEFKSITGVGFSPAQKTKSGMVDTLEEMAERSLTGRSTFTKFREAQKTALDKYTEHLQNKFWARVGNRMTPQETGMLLDDALSGENTIFKETANSLYAQVDDVAKGAKVNLKPLKEFARNVQKVADKRAGIGSTQAGDSLLAKVQTLDDTVTFKEAQSIRSGLIDETMATTSKDKAHGLAKQFLKITDKSMEAGARNLSDDALATWRMANRFYKEGKETYNNKFIKRLVRNLEQNPETAVQVIFGENKVSNMQKVKNIVDKKTWKSLSNTWLEKTIAKSMDADGTVLGKSFLKRFNALGEQGLKEAFSPREIQQIRNLGVIAKTLQKPTGGGGGMLIQLTQAGPIIGLLGVYTGRPEITAPGAFVTITPAILARIMTNPLYNKWFAEGISTPITSSKSTELGLKLLGVVRSLEKEKEETEKSPKQ